MYLLSRKKESSNTQKRGNSLTHPIYGANLVTVGKLLWENRPLSNKLFPKISIALGSAIARWPLTQIERLYTELTVKSVQMQPPIFIIGHWRSGTTHLANILSQSPRFGFVSPIASGLPWELLTLGRVFRPSLEKSIPADRLIDKVPVTPNSPQEDEFAIANMFPVSFLHGLYFPTKLEYYIDKGIFWEGMNEKEIKSWESKFLTYLKKVYVYERNKTLIIRNPVYTARMSTISSMIPGAKFIHIYRNPYRVFVSMQNYYKKLLPALALEKYKVKELDEIILNTYVKLMQQYDRDAKQMQSNNLIEIRYEELDEQPLEAMKKIYQQLELGGFDQEQLFFENYLSGIQSYQKNSFQIDTVVASKVDTFMGDYLEKWGYVKMGT